MRRGCFLEPRMYLRERWCVRERGGQERGLGESVGCNGVVTNAGSETGDETKWMWERFLQTRFNRCRVWKYNGNVSVVVWG